ncbi:hypothetical protein [Bacillus cereus group sp. BY6-1LC]|uniref:hypothetical protein n=1 Tax=Bacillus cereus group sp. BY6-1LC TaxID=3018077 RepID=UPI0022E58D2A|nr:hypothetical protein [Bacillus cereus group sp. BY6-1LC]MDA1802814.1 hypothetical protein [Bacillus cereus group sp. BY6-1LC]
MKYEQLESNVKKSFATSVRNSVEDLIRENDYEGVEKPITDEGFVQKVVDDLMAKRGFQKWGKIEFEIDDEDMKVMIEKIETKMRKKKISEKQLKYYNDMLISLAIEEEMPTDYLLFQKRMIELKEMCEEREPVSESQLKEIKKLWEKFFGEELKTGESVSKGEFNHYFNIIIEKMNTWQ